MPHSSGGGSHGGGSHSSHSGGYHGSGGGSHGGGIPNTVKVSKKPFDGAFRYVYYSKGGKCHYIYKSGNSDKPDYATSIFAFVFFTIILAAVYAMCYVMGVFIPKPLDLSSYDSQIRIEDSVGLIDRQELMPALDTFKNTSGVSPAIELVYHSDWKGNYSNLETFAYSEYLRMFDDEKHWLVVISYPDDYKDKDFVDWEWEGMIGDDCDIAINYISEKKFTETMHKHLLRTEEENLAAEIAKAYIEYSENVMDKQIIKGVFVFFGFCVLIYIGFMWLFVNDLRTSILNEKAVIVLDGARECNCEYCGRMYVSGTVSLCPGCGAPVPANNSLYNQA